MGMNGGNRGHPDDTGMTRWQQLVYIFGPVLEGMLIAVVCPLIAAALALAIGAGPFFYTVSALGLVAVYFWYRL
ncbi:hypothetical protein SAMN05444422_109162 [Halobiforma haloterrestris]|uniref:Uncharacterized protein n=1 Tax=Natronobacterium haloterrestre TaxID=148448 RepID=A0A1I1JRU3_NATHA|nr:hypothetical protein SAMN05444422_109162 [Halobiforma haloterrestris]